MGGAVWKMARYKEREKPEHMQRISVFLFFFPFLSLLYAEFVFSSFLGMQMTVYKVLFSLSLGCISIVLSGLTPWRVINYFLQTAYTLFCTGFIAVQYLCFRACGAYFAPMLDFRTNLGYNKMV